MGASTTMGVRFSADERAWVTEYAKFMGQSVSEVIREAVFEKIEDELDRRAYLEAKKDDDGVTYSMEEVMAEFGDE